MLIRTGTYDTSESTISADLFGVIQTGFPSDSSFARQADALAATNIRWPGGTISETRPDVYGLDVEALFDAAALWSTNPDLDRATLVEVIQAANAGGHDLSIIIPTVRYSDDIEQGREHLSQFLTDLFVEKKYGLIENNVTFEIGNEYINFDVFRESPEAYGEIANNFINVIQESVASHVGDTEGPNISIGVQAGYTDEHNTAIISQISEDNLLAVSEIVIHHLPISFEHFNSEQTGSKSSAADWGQTVWENKADYYQQWKVAIEESAGASDELKLSLTAWNVGAGFRDVEDVHLTFNDYGLRQASSNIEVLSTYAEIGVETAYLWGVGTSTFNQVSHLDSNGAVLSPGGHAFRQMSESLPGTWLIQASNGADRSDPYGIYAYENEETLVVFATANDFEGSELSVSLEFENLSNFELVVAQRIGAGLSNDFAGGFEDPDARLNEYAKISDFLPTLEEDQIQFDFLQDFEVVQFVFYKTETVGDKHVSAGTSVGDQFDGAALTDIVDGGDGDDTISGGAGEDLLFGGQGDDQLYGGFQADRIYGGDGNDFVDAGNGKDFVQLGSGNDVFRDTQQVGRLGVDEVHGGDGDDVIQGGGGNDRFYGGKGNDVISGGDERDFIDGGDGDDYLDGERGGDRIEGGSGADEIYGFGGYDSLAGGDGDDKIAGGNGNDVLKGGTGRDHLSGGSGFDLLLGGGGGDFMFGNDGNDKLFGYGGGDILRGNNGNDELYGGLGADRLVGGQGDDLLVGGVGGDSFIFREGEGNDVISDFDPSIDLISLASHIGFESFGQISAVCTQGVGSVDIQLGKDQSLTLLGLSLDELHPDMFVFA